MPRTSKTTIVIKNGDCHLRLSKVFFSSDGSYYSTLPYHRSGKAFLFKATVDYDAGTHSVVSETGILDSGTVEDEKIKLSPP